MKALVVGAGAVGKVLGAHLSRGGADVTYLVKPSQVEALRDGFVLYPLHATDGRNRPIEIPRPQITTSTKGTWDLIVLAVSSTALRRGNWLSELAVGEATVLGIQPGLDDRDLVASHFGPERTVWGMFGFMSYDTQDLHEQLARPGTAYYRPPFTVLPLSGPKARVATLTKTFSHGGLPSKMHPDVLRSLAFGGAVLDLLVVALECAEFRIAQLRTDTALLADAHLAIAEAVTVAAKTRNAQPPVALSLLRPWMTRLLLGVAPHLLPFSLEPYLARHYTKVGDQTLAGLEHAVSTARSLSLPHQALDNMLGRLRSTRSPARAAR